MSHDFINFRASIKKNFLLLRRTLNQLKKLSASSNSAYSKWSVNISLGARVGTICGLLAMGVANCRLSAIQWLAGSLLVACWQLAGSLLAACWHLALSCACFSNLLAACWGRLATKASLADKPRLLGCWGCWALADTQASCLAYLVASQLAGFRV